MRDWLPDESETQSHLARSVMSVFELSGYRRVILPLFEYASVLENGASNVDSDALLRFVEPETGEVLALRSDLTLQIARLAATRLRGMPQPVRLAYEGSVLRRRHERARQHRQIPQAGIELLGREGPDGDLEVLGAAVRAVQAAGLEDFVLDLGHARIAGSLLDCVPLERRRPLIEALLCKDTVGLRRHAHDSHLDPRLFRALVELPALHGDASVWQRAHAVLDDTPAAPFVRELRLLADGLSEARLCSRIFLDLGETRNFEYYTGPMFQILAEGPGEPVGSGGRYDALLSRFGLDCPAAGFAVNLDNLGWAVRRTGVMGKGRTRVLIEGGGARARELAALLRHERVCAVCHDGEAHEAYATAWGYSHLVRLEADAAIVQEIGEPNARRGLPGPRRIELGGAGAELAQSIAREMDAGFRDR